jgi:hypothetical protein
MMIVKNFNYDLQFTIHGTNSKADLAYGTSERNNNATSKNLVSPPKTRTFLAKLKHTSTATSNIALQGTQPLKSVNLIPKMTINLITPNQIESTLFTSNLM